MRPHPFYSARAVRQQQATMFDSSSFVTSRGRGLLLLVALLVASTSTALMQDGVITEMYGLALAPLYLFMMLTAFDVISSKAPDVSSYGAYLSGRNNTCRALGETAVRAFHWGLWFVVLVLLPLYLSGLSTVPAFSFLFLVALWTLVVIAAQLSGPQSVLRPITLFAIADYLTSMPLGPAPAPDLENPLPSSDVTSPEDDADGFFDQKLGTQRTMSVNNSLRSSPPRPMDDGLIVSDHGDDELRLHDSDEDTAMIARGAHVIVHRRNDADVASFSPDASDDSIVADLVGTS
jgi:hypothetical protein